MNPFSCRREWLVYDVMTRVVRVWRVYVLEDKRGADKREVLLKTSKRQWSEKREIYRQEEAGPE